jgi:hypothetical protein
MAKAKKIQKNRNTSGLKPWKKGQSGNPKGRPKRLPKLEDLIREELGEVDGEENEAKIRLIVRNMIAEATSKKAFNKNTQAASMLLDRAYGKVKEALPEEKNQPKQITGFNIKIKE